MHDHEISAPTVPEHKPWNRAKLIGAKPPLRPKHVWSIRTKLQVEGRMRDLAMFNLAIDSKLRGCDVVALKVEDIAPHGYAVDRATVRQRKTGQPVRFEVTEQTRQAVDDYIRATGKKPGEFLFVSRRGLGRYMTTRQYARLVAEWVRGIGLDPSLFGTHSGLGQFEIRGSGLIGAHSRRTAPDNKWHFSRIGPIMPDESKSQPSNTGPTPVAAMTSPSYPSIPYVRCSTGKWNAATSLWRTVREILRPAPRNQGLIANTSGSGDIGGARPHGQSRVPFRATAQAASPTPQH